MDPSNAPSVPPPEAPRDEAALAAGQFFTRTLAVWRANVLPFTAVSAVLAAPLLLASFAVLGLAARRGGRNLEYGLWTVSDWITMILLLLVAMSLAEIGALSRGVALHASGRSVRVGSMLAWGLGRAVPVVAVGALAPGALFALGSAMGFGALMLPGLLVPLALAPAVPAASVERLGPWAALRRTWRLTRGHRLSLTLSLVGVALLSLFAISAVKQGASLLLEGMPGARFLVETVGWLVFSPVPLLLPAVAYFELRRAVEGTIHDELVAVFE
jgi:hypothetical protein